ncbi:glycine cleavage system aminomethyltransferase GcvT [Legionella quinlivanii]|uniref:glycine cleavage system aminomethyltransferase GcvT n=1 Tax=Legionella quinlivanii TaxID=45073 RepID=UPI0022439936|nr:glycine cleavage system aminomethyltransferase GcvT [Legionella quinlivanii]MCW8452472.1 glycine cleavage system aminomethyltransferase GcvT [Legionella quinlivanii]
MVAKTPLHSLHLELGAKMVNFHDWDMPLHYGSQLEEHHIVRKAAGIFDVSHMTVVDILGAGGRQFLRKLLTNDVDQLAHTGRALYSCMCNEHGGIIDDLIVYQRASDNYRIVLNSATRDRDLAWIREKSAGFSIGLQERTELSMLAVQGPQALAKTLSVLTPAQADAISTLAYFECVDVNEYFFARTGYTGEEGLEIILPPENAKALWTSLIQAGVKPCGLAARDTLRLEAGMLLYGQDMDETTTPLESGLGWTVKWQPEDRDFIGMGALISQKQHGVKRKLVGLILEDKGIMRSGQRVAVQGENDGIITSGTYSPTLEKSVALARVPAGTGDEVQVEIRGKLLNAKVVKPRFVKNGAPL